MARHREHCNACGAHRDGADHAATGLFEHRSICVCTACGAQGERDEINRVETLCDVCGEPAAPGEVLLDVRVERPTWAHAYLHQGCLARLEEVIERAKAAGRVRG